ncbi:ParB/RepB/Spo0J family partition protein [Thermomonas hydrothermalis]|uniref:Probable chromosome-partitioning protein ParB n=1 Tax=Thermomonas hydrothermalis TaxID=213588 RepID=A0A1M4TME4_9GAMM|nr:ParB/RepB/Spo0J family partition protein [Thermomonas hydrothermalis]MCL6619538.1 ParB/RepB/Spo0J family partition protein [Thermomonas hydrothermalis]SHE45575.1 chromosome partitioning protein, ParB family [Thermomonas hydrothermalis]
MSTGSANKPAARKRGLGRGLEALLGPKAAAEAPALQQAMPGDELRTLPIDAMVPGRYQPRRTMDDAKLDELAASIKAQGVIQPIVVRERRSPDGKSGRTYEIIAGERRWRASQRAGLSEVPVVIREVDDRTVVAMALIENIQREDLNPLEEAQALQRLIDEFDLTHAAAAEAVGRSRAAVSNLLRLLELPEPVRALVQTGELEMGHARALLPLAEPMAVSVAKQAAAEGWSVRQVEHHVQQLLAGKMPVTPRKTTARKPPQADIAALERELTELLGNKVSVLNGRGNKGRLVIHYANLDALEGVLERLRRR